MSNTLILIENAADPDTWQTYAGVDNICSFLKQYFDGHLPDNTRIYHDELADDHDVTPSQTNLLADINKLMSMQGKFYIVVYPQFFLGGILGTILKIIIVGALLYLFSPKPPKPRNTRAASPNNELSTRTNEARIDARIPDIFGTVRSTPDLIAAPFREYVNHKEVEKAYMCIGRGKYDVREIKDDTTDIEQIAGTSVEIYGPYTSPNSGDEPELRIGDPIDEEVLNTKRSNSVTGQTLRAPNQNNVKGSNNIIFVYPDTIEVLENSDVDFTDFFSPGDQLTLSNSSYVHNPGSGQPSVVFNGDAGTYTILSVNANFIGLENPALINNTWDNLPDMPNGETGLTSATLETDSPKYVGPFTLDVTTLNRVFANFVASQGLFKDNGERQTKVDVEVELELTPVDINGDEIGSPETFTGEILGSAVSKSQRAITIKAMPTFTGRCKARARRLTDTNLTFEGTVVDEIKWGDLYAVSDVNKNDFGNVTTVQAVTVATTGALSIKDRKLNMIVTRFVPVRGNVAGNLVASDNVADIFTAICVDSKIGNRSLQELDITNIYNTVGEIAGYFGSSKAVEFGYTFDDINLSFEETITSVAETMFCKAYRQGSVLKITFEKETEDSRLLFCHRNKIPDTETRTVRFGNENENDGVELNYVDPEDDAIITFYIPEDQSATNPKKVDTVGVRNKLLARFHAYRIYNKIFKQNTAVEFEATSEAALLLLNDRVLIADNTRNDTQDGEVDTQNGLLLTVSSNVTFEAGQNYTIFLQMADGTIDSMGVSAGSSSREILLERAPLLPLVLEDEKYVKTLFQIVKDSSPREQPFLLTERQLKERATFNIQAINYSDEYYTNDLDFKNNIVDETGELV